MNKYFIGSTQRGALSYKCGEKIVFELTLTDGASAVPCHAFRWHIEAEDAASDGLCEGTEGECDGSLGACVIETSISRPGFVHLTVTATGDDGNPLSDCDIFEGGAGAEVETLLPILPEPEDFDEFWRRSLALLDGISPEVIEMNEVKSIAPGYRQYDVRVACGDPEKLGGTPKNRFGAPVSGYLTVPEGAESGKKYPIQLYFMGYSYTGALPMAAPDAITFFPNPHGIKNGLAQEEYDREQNATVGAFGFDTDENKTPDSVYFKWMLLRGVQSLRFAKTLGGWDGKNIVVSGGSMGAFQSCGVAMLCPEVTALNIDIPWLCDLGGITANRLRGWRPEITAGGELQRGICYYDTASLCARASCPVKIVAGLGDYVCPPSGVMSLYNRIKAPKTITWQQNRTHPYVPPVVTTYTLRG